SDRSDRYCNLSSDEIFDLLSKRKINLFRASKHLNINLNYLKTSHCLQKSKTLTSERLKLLNEFMQSEQTCHWLSRLKQHEFLSYKELFLRIIYSYTQLRPSKKSVPSSFYCDLQSPQTFWNEFQQLHQYYSPETTTTPSTTIEQWQTNFYTYLKKNRLSKQLTNIWTFDLFEFPLLKNSTILQIPEINEKRPNNETMKISVIYSFSNDGQTTKPYYIFPYSLRKSNEKGCKDDDDHVYNENGHIDATSFLKWINNVFLPSCTSRSSKKPTLLVFCSRLPVLNGDVWTYLDTKYIHCYGYPYANNLPFRYLFERKIRNRSINIFNENWKKTLIDKTAFHLLKNQNCNVSTIKYYFNLVMIKTFRDIQMEQEIKEDGDENNDDNNNNSSINKNMANHYIFNERFKEKCERAFKQAKIELIENDDQDDAEVLLDQKTQGDSWNGLEFQVKGMKRQSGRTSVIHPHLSSSAEKILRIKKTASTKVKQSETATSLTAKRRSQPVPNHSLDTDVPQNASFQMDQLLNTSSSQPSVHSPDDLIKQLNQLLSVIDQVKNHLGTGSQISHTNTTDHDLYSLIMPKEKKHPPTDRSILLSLLPTIDNPPLSPPHSPCIPLPALPLPLLSPTSASSYRKILPRPTSDSFLNSSDTISEWHSTNSQENSQMNSSNSVLKVQNILASQSELDSKKSNSIVLLPSSKKLTEERKRIDSRDGKASGSASNKRKHQHVESLNEKLQSPDVNKEKLNLRRSKRMSYKQEEQTITDEPKKQRCSDDNIQNEVISSSIDRENVHPSQMIDIENDECIRLTPTSNVLINTNQSHLPAILSPTKVRLSADDVNVSRTKRKILSNDNEKPEEQESHISKRLRSSSMLKSVQQYQSQWIPPSNNIITWLKSSSTSILSLVYALTESILNDENIEIDDNLTDDQLEWVKMIVSGINPMFDNNDDSTNKIWQLIQDTSLLAWKHQKEKRHLFQTSI
ncbi:unnamed protein product, partial [Didymodactylos carnosus]